MLSALLLPTLLAMDKRDVDDAEVSAIPPLLFVVSLLLLAVAALHDSDLLVIVAASARRVDAREDDVLNCIGVVDGIDINAVVDDDDGTIIITIDKADALAFAAALRAQ